MLGKNAGGYVSDYDDTMQAEGLGLKQYGLMQALGENGNTLFGFSCFSINNQCDVTIGNDPSKHKDGWANGACKNYKSGEAMMYTYAAINPCSNSPEFKDNQLVEQFDLIDGAANWDEHHEVKRAFHKKPTTMTRVAYCMKLKGKWVWSSFDHTDVEKVGIPVHYTDEQIKIKANVYSNDKAILKTGANFTVSVEFWPHG